MAPNDSFEAEKLAKEQDCAILLVIHDKRVLDLSDRIIYMENRAWFKNRQLWVTKQAKASYRN